MSILHMRQVWAMTEEISDPTLTLLLLRLADRSREDTGDSWAGIASLAKDSRVSERQVQRLLMRAQKITLEDGRPLLDITLRSKGGRGLTNVYHINLDSRALNPDTRVTVSQSVTMTSATETLTPVTLNPDTRVTRIQRTITKSKPKKRLRGENFDYEQDRTPTPSCIACGNPLVPGQVVFGSRGSYCCVEHKGLKEGLSKTEQREANTNQAIRNYGLRTYPELGQ